MYAERSERQGRELETPCETCRVILAEENFEAARIYNMIGGQVRTVGERIIDLDHVALWQAIDRYGVKNPVRVFEIVNSVFQHFLDKETDESS